jgi:hypothetical protein
MSRLLPTHQADYFLLGEQVAQTACRDGCNPLGEQVTARSPSKLHPACQEGYTLPVH